MHSSHFLTNLLELEEKTEFDDLNVPLLLLKELPPFDGDDLSLPGVELLNVLRISDNVFVGNVGSGKRGAD